MNISINFLKRYLDLPADLSYDQLSYDLTMRTVEVEEVIKTADKFHDIVVGEIDTVIIGFCHLAFVGEGTCTRIFLIQRCITHRHQRELAVVVDPRRRLVGLLEAAHLVGGIYVDPAVSIATGLRGPEVHAPRQGGRRIGENLSEVSRYRGGICMGRAG